ncbi:MAG: 16S rRNA (guanine(966)-N(2))-methyltransferase RsmD [Rhodospirillales bacterium]|nr:16S rRNA (guanine(966)-N(2))-methyltransferase RsmD [Rhodospirillales bacterium]MCB9996158.1 16S rRNA (guanine(966)-N(2))-methyltransferase RsmD [Rhodospirillales bacterium]
MRITGGQYRGRIIAVPKGKDIRPTSDKVRQAVFNSLLHYGLPDGAQVLDLFCGTGVLGLEALSRGAEYCAFNDKNADSLRCAQQNIKALGLEAQCRTMHKDAGKLGEKPLNLIPATLVFLDPPYRQALVLPALEAAAKHGWLAPGALCVIECEKEADIYVPPVFSLVKRRLYGDTQIVFCSYGAMTPP